MGDRANVVIKQQGSDGKPSYVALYTHWGGDDLLKVVQSALKKKWRWSDDAYLARIVFDEMIGESKGEETSFGIAANHLCDNEHAVIVLDCERKRIGLATEDAAAAAFGEGKNLETFVEWDFVRFIELSDKEVELAWAVDRSGRAYDRG